MRCSSSAISRCPDDPRVDAQRDAGDFPRTDVIEGCSNGDELRFLRNCIPKLEEQEFKTIFPGEEQSTKTSWRMALNIHLQKSDTTTSRPCGHLPIHGNDENITFGMDLAHIDVEETEKDAIQAQC